MVRMNEQRRMKNLRNVLKKCDFMLSKSKLDILPNKLTPISPKNHLTQLNNDINSDA